MAEAGRGEVSAWQPPGGGPSASCSQAGWMSQKDRSHQPEAPGHHSHSSRPGGGVSVLAMGGGRVTTPLGTEGPSPAAWGCTHPPLPNNPAQIEVSL